VFDLCDERGFVIIPDLLTPPECDALAASLPLPNARRGGVRNLIDHPSVRALVASAAVVAITGDTVAMTATLFDKTEAANWNVGWHQDRATTATLAIRFHLDDCGEANGPLRVIGGSHRRGIIPENAIAGMASAEVTTLVVRKGAAVVMRPLLLHASSKAAAPEHRRVLHVEFR
jgi:ectoine hydroxylase-related dioxygenase (phytanoyl-CoA dioxygenase family)